MSMGAVCADLAAAARTEYSLKGDCGVNAHLDPPPLNKKGSISSRLWMFLILNKVFIRFYLL